MVVFIYRPITKGDIMKKSNKKQKSLVEKNMGLVVSIARKFQNRGLCIEDLTQEGVIGLMEAVNRYDASLGFAFSTYATHWIRQAILSAIYNKGAEVRLPVHIQNNLRKVLTAKNSLDSESSKKEIIQESGLSEKTFNKLETLAKTSVSLSNPVGKEESSTLEDLICDNSDLEGSYFNKQKEVLVKELLNSLDDKQAYVLKMRFGFETGEPQTLEEVGQVMNLTRERVRQIEAKALMVLSKRSKDKKHLIA